MSNKDYYIGHYRSSFASLKFNRVKYTTICYVLDFFALINSTTGLRWSKTRDELTNAVIKQGHFRNSKINRVSIGTTISQMIMMGILEEHGDIITFSQGAIEAYQSHTFHNILFNVNAEYQSRVLSMVAISVAIISCIASIVFFLIK